MKNYQVSIYGQFKATISATSPMHAVRKASFIYTNGNAAGISVAEIN